MEQPRPLRTDGAVSGTSRRPFVPGALLTALVALAGCWAPTQYGMSAVPAAHTLEADRPMHLLPLELIDDQDAIVRIVGDVTCTGTLIADDRVLTAHHCVAERDRQGRVLEQNMAPDAIEIELGHDLFSWGEVKVKAIVAPDCGYTSGDGDIAILVLTRHLVGMPVSATRIEAAPERRDTLKVYGFGRCAFSTAGYDDNGKPLEAGEHAFPHAPEPIHRALREARTIDSVSPGRFEAQASICPGDSGGPVYGSRGDLIGVVSASVMDGDDHTLGRSVFTRVDVWPQLFSAAHEISLGESPGELPPYGDCRVRASAPAR